MSHTYTDPSGIRVTVWTEMKPYLYQFPLIRYLDGQLCKDAHGWYFDSGKQATISLEEAAKLANIPEADASYMGLKYGI